MLGTVKWFDAKKGFGFIQPDDKSNDVFVHMNAVEKAGLDDLKEGDRLSFELHKGTNNRYAAGDLKKA